MTQRPLIKGPGELLATVPILLGFEPRDSLVVVGVRGTSEIGIVMRVDRNDCLIAEVVDPLARAIASHLARDGSDAVILVSYTDADVRLACDAADAVRAILQESCERVDQWAVTRGRFFSPGCAEDQCCPTGGTPLPDPAPAVGAALRITDASHRGAAAALIDVGANARRNAARAGDRWLARCARDIERWREDSWELWNQALAHVRTRDDILTPPTAGKLVVALHDARVRDAAIVSLIPGSAVAAEAVLRGKEGESVTRALQKVLDPERAVRPEPGQGDPARLLCLMLCAYASVGERAPMITMVALLAWWEGEPDAAVDLCALARCAQPGYRLADLLEATIRCHGESGWRRSGQAKPTKPGP